MVNWEGTEKPLDPPALVHGSSFVLHLCVCCVHTSVFAQCHLLIEFSDQEKYCEIRVAAVKTHTYSGLSLTQLHIYGGNLYVKHHY